jgi:hypothetical protein
MKPTVPAERVFSEPVETTKEDSQPIYQVVVEPDVSS